jgi:hypothetical protein
MSIKQKYSVKSIDNFQCKDWLIHKHYLHRMTSFTYSFGLYESNMLVGVITFGNAIPLTMKKSLFGVNNLDSFSISSAGSAVGAGNGFKALGSVMPRRSD